MSATWAINGTSLAALGLEFTGGTFNTGTRSVMTLRKVGDFTGADVFPWGSQVTLTRDGVPYFQGKVNSLPHNASESDESQEIEIVDAWQDLEETIYKEDWPVGLASVKLPIAILGRKPDGSACTDAEQIAEAVGYAASSGVYLQMGAIPAGLPLWQSEVRNVSVAEVIRLSLRFHPDWVPWIDHANVPPRLNFTKRADLTTRTIDIGDGDTASVGIRRRDDLKPDAVEILYLNATIIDGETYRDFRKDRYPAGSHEGPRVISNVVELAGGQMQFQKQRIQTRKLPTSQATAKDWLKLKYPQIKDVPDDHFTVTQWSKKLIEEADDHPEPINPRAERLEVDAEKLDEELPRELIRGSVEDWMRRKVGRVRIGFQVKAAAGASSESRAALEGVNRIAAATVTATNAITKIYKGITQWVAPEAAPVGIAQSIYNSLSAYQYEGSITTVMEDVGVGRFHGCKLNIAGGRGEWAGMNALVHSVSFDIASGSTTVSVGPAPFLAAQDMLELARLLRGRPVTWMSEDERTSNELGAEKDPGSKGDSVGGYEGPMTEVEYAAPVLSNRFTFEGLEKDEDGEWRVRIGPGCILYHEMTQRSDFDSGSGRKPQHVRGIFPTVEVDGDKVRIDDPSGPGLELGSRDAASVWLVCKKERCQTASSIDNERLEIVDRGDEPEIDSGEDAYQVVDFDVEELDGGEKRANEVQKYLQSDLVQNYLCDKGGSSDDSYDGSEDFGSSFFSDSSSGGGGSTPSGSSDEDEEDEDAECQVRVAAGWENAVTCFPKAAGAGTACIAAPYRFTIKVKFIFKQPFGGVRCTAIAYGASLSGGIIENPPVGSTTTEYRWRDDAERELTFYVASPPACGSLQLTWRVKTFGPEPGFGGHLPDDPGCCNWEDGDTVTVVMRDALTTGSWNASKTKLPPVCGCTCSSSVPSSDSGSGSDGGEGGEGGGA